MTDRLRCSSTLERSPPSPRLDALIDCTKRDLKKIKKKETKLNTQNAEQTAQLLQLSTGRDALVSDLKETANSNHALMEELETVNQ
jgi:hypothetical protein